MYLKRLEIQGFKSFADKVEFEFPSGITAIVGPNGSGKSNVVDSIRWVLGEQSVKNLRGSKMEDVIFAGSTERRPLGMAQVSLTLDNSARIFDLDYEEVTVSRRLYRSGESEYLINKSPSRLKDIQELFMDTGLGREGLSIISQGKVDEILSLKPEDRRGLIEEAAGIIKYKYRKREAERKLKDTEDNLLRVEDIINELAERVGPLGEQAEKAKDYKEKKAMLDGLELSMEVHDMVKNQAQEKELLTQHSQMEDAMAEQSAKLSAQDAELSQMRLDAQQEETAFQEQQQSYYDLQNQLDRRHSTIDTDTQLLAHTAEQIVKLRAEIDTQAQELASSQEAHQAKEREAKEAETQYRQFETLVKEQQESLFGAEQQIVALESAQEANKTAVFANMQAQANNNNALQRLEHELSGGERGKEKLEQKLAELHAQKEAQNQLRIELEEQITAEEEKQKAHEKAVKSLETDVEQRKNQQFIMRQELNEIQNTLQEKQSRAKALKELEESGDGYQYGVKSVLEQKQKGKFQGVIGTVSQLITVPQKYEKAIETQMGASLQNLVTEDDKQAQEAIAFLKERKKGRATFLPLNTVKGQRAEEDLSKEPGVLGLAVDLIEYDAKYENILLHLLGKVWVINDLASAVAIGKKRGFGHRMVTLDGELVTPGGALTGGHHDKEKTGLLARQRQILELEAEAEQLKQQMNEKNDALDAYYAQTNSMKEEITALHNQDSEFVRALAEMNAQMVQIFKEDKRIGNEIAMEEFALKEQEQLRKNHEASYAEEQARKETLAQEENRLNAETETLKEQMLSAVQTQKTMQSAYSQNEVQMATAKQRWELLQEQFAADSQRFRNVTMSLDNKKAEVAVLEEKKLQYETEIAQEQEKIKEEQVVLSGRQELLNTYKANRQTKLETISALEEAVKTLRKANEQSNQQKYQLDLNLNRVQGYLSSGYRRLEQNFGCTLEEAKARAVELESIPKAQKQIHRLKNYLTGLGEINFTAIEEYDQVNERLEFLKTQVGDLYEAKASLNKVIQEMEKIMAQKFAETYAEVNARFSEVFQSMFGGGQARLELSDPEDYLLTGIEIIAQPPGKKEQVLTLLSGGERAMTAIALLFSLLTVKPSPFCILDEIESALDDVNIDRFARFIKEYAEKTQFIIISHRKGTMEAADVLYGVAMENKGVSRLMSVKVSDYK